MLTGRNIMEDKVAISPKDKQHRISDLWGRFALAGSQIAVIVSAYTMLMVTINAYVPISTWLIGYGIHIRFWMFMIIIIVPIIIAYFFAWRFLVAPFYRSSVEQFWLQSNPLIKKIDNIEKILNTELPEIKKRLEGLEKK